MIHATTCHPLALPGLAAPLLRYWWNSQPKRYARAVPGTSRLIETCVDEHEAMAEAAGVEHMLRRSGWMRVFDGERALDETVRNAEASRRHHGVTFEALDGDGLAAAEPHLMARRARAVHFTNAPWVADPHALVVAYARRLEAMGGRFATGDAMGLSRAGKGWRVPTADGMVEAGAVVVALGAHSARLTSRFGYSPPMFGERGYHMHYGMPLRDAGKRGAEPSDDGHGERVHADADAGGHQARDGGGVRAVGQRGDTDTTGAGGAGGAQVVAAGGAGGQRAVAGGAAVHAGHGAGDLGGAEAGGDVGGIRARQRGADAGAEHRAAAGGDDGRGGDVHRSGTLPSGPI